MKGGRFNYRSCMGEVIRGHSGFGEGMDGGGGW